MQKSMMNSRRISIIALVVSLSPMLATAQISKVGNVATKSVLPVGVERIDWKIPAREVGFDGTERIFLMFDGAIFDSEQSLPMVLQNIRVGNSNTIKASLQQTRFEQLTNEERNALGNIVPSNSIEITVDTYKERKQSFARVTFIPLRKNPS